MLNLAFVCVIVVIVMLAIAFLRMKSIAKEFKMRPLNEQTPWPASVDAELIARVLEIIADDIGCSVTQIRPNDRVKMLSFFSDGFVDDDECDFLLERLSSAMDARFYWDANWETLLDVLNGLNQQLAEERSKKQGGR